MNIRISAIATNVMLVTVMPRNSRSILFSQSANPAPDGTGAGGPPYTENGTQYPGQVYSEVSTPSTIDASGISGPPPTVLRRPSGIIEPCLPSKAAAFLAGFDDNREGAQAAAAMRG